MQRGSRPTLPPRIEVPLLRIPGDEAMRPFQGQFGTFIQRLTRDIDAKTPDPIQVQGDAAVSLTMIGLPDTADVFSGGGRCCSGRIGRLVVHETLTLL